VGPTLLEAPTAGLCVDKLKVGNEFGSVEALWSQFENVMAKNQEPKGDEANGEQGRGDGNEEDLSEEKKTT